MNIKSPTPLFIFLILFLSLFLLFRFIVFAIEELYPIVATVKISICGNNIIEGGEDCEGENLNGQTCESLGYGPGTLKCDIACSFDTSECSPAPTSTPTPTPTNTPTPTPTSTPTLTPIPTNTLTPTPTSATGPTNTPEPGPTNTPGPAPTSTPTPTPALPSAVAVFDIDGSGKIEITEVFASIKTWVEEWKEILTEEIALAKGEVITPKKIKKCDVNRDGKCDLLDFSVLLYYIGR